MSAYMPAESPVWAGGVLVPLRRLHADRAEPELRGKPVMVWGGPRLGRRPVGPRAHQLPRPLLTPLCRDRGRSDLARPGRSFTISAKEGAPHPGVYGAAMSVLG